MGNNTLSQTVHRLCTSAGIKGYKTNHSLHVTSATRMFQGGVDEQLIMSRTGHRSIEGVRAYKRISGEQRMELSHVLNNATNGNRATKNIYKEADNSTVSVSMHSSVCQSSTIHLYHHIHHHHQFKHLINFCDCTSITVNINK